VYGSVTILRRQLVTKPGGQPVSEPTPPDDILVLVLTRDSCTVYKAMIVMCGILSLILLLFRVDESSFSCRTSLERVGGRRVRLRFGMSVTL